ncbi:MAG: DUF885 domain-containing protein [SAR86 cluster bacterium]|jgi:uncharacterized protein (DUF885 family)|nr:DUF885 domain-containing protein [SAR86 cluster bacterium]
MKKFLKAALYSLGLLLLVGVIYLSNLFLFKPFSLDHYLAKELISEMLDSPESLTYLGVIDRFNWVTNHQSKISISGLDDLEEDLIDAKNSRAMLLSYDEESLSEQQKITKKIAVFDLNNFIKEEEEFPFHNYPLNQIGGIHLNLVEFMTDVHPIRNKKEAEAYIERLDLFDDSFKGTLEILNEQKKAGIFPPEFVFDHVVRQLDEFLNFTKNDNPLRKVYIRKINDLDLDEEDIKELISQLDESIENSVNPGFRLLYEFIKETRSQANEFHGVWSLPNGDEFYALRLKVYTTTDYSAQDIHDIGLAEVDRITKRMQAIALDLGYGEEVNVGKLMNKLNEDPNFLYADTPDRKETVVNDYNSIVEETWQIAGDYFHNMPTSKVEVRAVPEYSEKNQAGGYYMSPALDGSRPGVFYANLYDIKQTPTYSMRTLAFHEAIPGHHLQVALNLENEDLTLYRRFGYGTSAFSEGWALYSERLAVEAGLAEDPYDELGVLQSELFRAVRLVVDTGLHFKRWTREEAMAYMKDITGMSDTEVRVEIERYIVWPGQACSYKVGMLKILELREKAKEELGDNFDIKDFHSIVLEQGQPPLFIVEELVDKMIAEK